MIGCSTWTNASAHMAHVNQELMSATRTVRDDGSRGLLGGLLAKAVLFTGAKGTIVAAHCEIERLQPWVAGLLHQPLRTQTPAVRDLIQRALLGRDPSAAGDVILTTRTGRSENFHVTATASRNARGKVSGAIVAVYDLTSVQEVSSNLTQLVGLASIGTNAAELAHEIKNAMVAVNTFVDILVSSHQDDELAPIVSSEIRRIDKIVAQMLRISKPLPAELRTVRIHDLLDHALTMAQHRLSSAGIQLDRQFDADPDVIIGEAGQLEQAFLNLIYNAVDAMGCHGTLTVSTQLLSSTERARVVRVSFGDTGVGIAPEEMEHLFVPFRTTKPNGNGLGLVVTQRIVVNHGGTIQVSSCPGGGTTFTLEMPSAARQP